MAEPGTVARSEARTAAIVDLYLDGWSARSIAGYLATSRSRVSDTLRRWVAEGLPGLADRSRAPRHPARKVDLKAMAAIRRLQANPEPGVNGPRGTPRHGRACPRLFGDPVDAPRPG